MKRVEFLNRMELWEFTPQCLQCCFQWPSSWLPIAEVGPPNTTDDCLLASWPTPVGQQVLPGRWLENMCFCAGKRGARSDWVNIGPKQIIRKGIWRKPEIKYAGFFNKAIPKNLYLRIGGQLVGTGYELHTGQWRQAISLACSVNFSGLTLNFFNNSF